MPRRRLRHRSHVHVAAVLRDDIDEHGQHDCITAVSPPFAVTTLDCSGNNWLYATVTFSTASTSNSCQLQTYFVLGMN